MKLSLWKRKSKLFNPLPTARPPSRPQPGRLPQRKLGGRAGLGDHPDHAVPLRGKCANHVER
jgi:hypothetical protein